MGTIKPEVESMHLAEFSQELEIIKPFINGFDITWARRRRAFNTELSIYFLKPEQFIDDLFGFGDEIMLAICDFSTLEPRSMQIAESFLNDDPAKGRVLQSMYFVVSKDINSLKWTQMYIAKNPQSRMPVVFYRDELINESAKDSWYIRNILSEQLYSRDLFNYQLPIDNDLFFFGRESVVASHIDAIKQHKNIGMFGLRKTGKTSILYKIKRIFEKEDIGLLIYIDAKLPSIRTLRWHLLLGKIIKKISSNYSIPIHHEMTEATVSDIFIEILHKIPHDKTLCLVFDEIEYISPIAKLDRHWVDDFIPFWQTLWAAQSQIRKLSNVIAGVNPSVAETDLFNGIQNPMFGIILPSYIKGLEEDDVRKMLRIFGKRMGLKFTQESISYMFNRYGGHPLLTRLACSQVHSYYSAEKIRRPIEVTIEFLKAEEATRENDIQFYCRHVVSELKLFYPDEYEMLELLASGQTLDYMELSPDQELVRHLNNYGLITTDKGGRPIFAIPVVGRYVGIEHARTKKQSICRNIVPSPSRESWVSRRTSSIIQDMRLLEKLIEKDGITPPIYGDRSFKEPERFSAIKPVATYEDFVTFINTCNRSFVEPVTLYGEKIGKKNYFWTDIKASLPTLWDALNRIKAYRNKDLHIEMTPAAEKYLNHYLTIDLEGKRISQVKDAWFILQQCILDELLTGIVCEINRFS